MLKNVTIYIKVRSEKYYWHYLAQTVRGTADSANKHVTNGNM